MEHATMLPILESKAGTFGTMYATVDSLPICNYNYTTCKFDRCSQPDKYAICSYTCSPNLPKT